MDTQLDETTFLSFICESCNQEIEAPADLAGQETECPACAALITIPYVSAPGTLWGVPLVNTKGPSPEQTEAMKSRTIRIELPDNW